MTRYCGVIGFSQSQETAPGVMSEVITEVTCMGDVLRDTREWNKGDSLNDNLMIRNIFSIICDDALLTKVSTIKYLEWLGTYWKVVSAEVQRPRVILTIGGVYNGK